MHAIQPTPELETFEGTHFKLSTQGNHRLLNAGKNCEAEGNGKQSSQWSPLNLSPAYNNFNEYGVKAFKLQGFNIQIRKD